LNLILHKNSFRNICLRLEVDRQVLIYVVYTILPSVFAIAFHQSQVAVGEAVKLFLNTQDWTIFTDFENYVKDWICFENCRITSHDFSSLLNIQN
jgi:hypothetical protein